MGLNIARGDDDAVALLDGSTHEVMSYRALRDQVERLADALLATSSPTLAFLAMRSDFASVVSYLTCLRAGVTVALIDPMAPSSTTDRLLAAYEPDLLFGFAAPLDAFDALPLPGLSATQMLSTTSGESSTSALLLPTSGSTGNPKMVRLSTSAVEANAESIVSALSITPGDRAMASLPLFYSYGLSILNSHLHAGASCVLGNESIIRPEFWETFRELRATGLCGVPYSYEMFRRIGMLALELPSLKTMTQAGGRLAPPLLLEFHASLNQRGVDFFVMYGQTEATARMTVLDPYDLPDFAGSVGRPVPNGHLFIEEPDSSGTGEVVYKGPNVMLGYAEGRPDLQGPDECLGVLRTGDLGRLDVGGRLWLTGRMKRIAKVFGNRVNLDDIEAVARRFGTCAAVDGGDRIVIFIEGSAALPQATQMLMKELRFPPRSIDVRSVEALPLTGAGKVDYQELSSVI